MAPRITEDILDQIRLRADIVEVVQSYVPALKREGRTWKACCPFHNEKTPSFVVSPDRQSYKCFGCGKGGDSFRFVMEMESLDFLSSAELLARKLGIVIPEPEPWHARGRNESGQTGVSRERLKLLHEKLASWYAKNLREHPDSEVGAYFRTRNIPSEIRDRFSIGAAPDSWDAAILFARSEGFTDDELRIAGIVSERENSNGHIYDFFRNRLMFPIWDEFGRPIAFSARSVEKNPDRWKYINTPETPIFKKSHVLYALCFARKSIDEKKFAILCEGQLDVIAMHRAGCTNAVAPQGTAFTPEQAHILRRYSQNVTLALDNDNAGRAAVYKDATILLPLGFTVRVTQYPGAKDADELLSAQGPEALQAAVRNASDFFDFALSDHLPNPESASPAEKAAAAKALFEMLLLIPDETARAFYREHLAMRLGVSENALTSDLEKRLLEKQRADAVQESRRFRRMQSQTVPGNADIPTPPAIKTALLTLFEIVLRDRTCAERAASEIQPDFLDRSVFSRALELVIQAAMNGEWENAPSLVQMMLSRNGIDAPELTSILASEASPTQEENPADPFAKDTTVQNPADPFAEDAATPPPTTLPDKRKRAHLEAGNALMEFLGQDSEKGEQAKRQEFQDQTYLAAFRVVMNAGLTALRAKLIRDAAALPDGNEKRRLAMDIMAISRRLRGLPDLDENAPENA